VNEDHQKVLKEVGFKLINHQRIAYMFDIAIYKKGGRWTTKK